MTTTFVPYKQRAEYPPPTATLRELRAELDRVREVYGARSWEAEAAFQRWCRESFVQGKPIDALRTHVADETERFFAQTIPGPDGHVYWDGPKDFKRNDGGYSRPRIWLWKRVHGPIPGGDAIVAVCGERNCVNPEHCVHPDRRERHKRFTDEAMLGALQVVALRLGRSPTQSEWERLKARPTSTIYYERFGSWTDALHAAGLEATHYQPHVLIDRATCLASLRLAERFLGRRPKTSDYRHDAPLRAALREAELPTASSTIKVHCGSWSAALKDAFPS